MRHSFFTAIMLAVVACTTPPSTGTAADEQAIRDGGTRWSAGWNKGDVKAMAGQFASRPAGMTMTITTGFVKWLSPTSAVAGGGWSVSGPTAAMSARGSWSSAYQKKDGAWLIASGLGANEPPTMPMVSDTARAHP